MHLFAVTGVLALALTGCAQAAPSVEGTPAPAASSAAPGAAALAAVSPAEGGLVGGERVTLTGEHLDAVTSVLFGEEAGTDLRVEGDGSLSVIVPAKHGFQPGAVAVTALTAEGTAVAGGANFDYRAVAPVDHQMQYLFTHWNNYNTSVWGNMNPSGGDCTNFTSQGLIARGWAQSPQWNSPGVNAPASTESWRFTPSMDQWLASDASRGAKRLELDQRDQLKIGDIGMFLWTGQGRPDHVMTVSSVKVVDGQTKVAFVSHNLDGDYRDLDELIAEKNAANTGGAQMKAWFYSIP